MPSPVLPFSCKRPWIAGRGRRTELLIWRKTSASESPKTRKLRIARIVRAAAPRKAQTQIDRNASA